MSAPLSGCQTTTGPLTHKLAPKISLGPGCWEVQLTPTSIALLTTFSGGGQDSHTAGAQHTTVTPAHPQKPSGLRHQLWHQLWWDRQDRRDKAGVMTSELSYGEPASSVGELGELRGRHWPKFSVVQGHTPWVRPGLRPQARACPQAGQHTKLQL